MWKANPELQINIFDVQCAWKVLSFLVENKLKFQKTVGRFSSKRITQTTHGELHVCFSIGSSKITRSWGEVERASEISPLFLAPRDSARRAVQEDHRTVP